MESARRSQSQAYDIGASSAQPQSRAAPADTNTLRTAERDSSEVYVAVGTTRNGGPLAAVAALKTRESRSGIEAEVFTASAQLGDQNEFQAGLARVGYSTAQDRVNFAVSVEALTARANVGTYNDDGTRGANLGAGATAVGIEATLGYSGWSLTAGAAISAGASVSSGERNSDADEVPERCFKGTIGPLTLGVCTEL
jgi:hypothetical protein